MRTLSLSKQKLRSRRSVQNRTSTGTTKCTVLKPARRMKPTSTNLSPVVSLFSQSPGASRRAQEALRALFSLDPVSCNLPYDDELDNTLKIPGFRRRWDSVASRCPTSGVIVHLISLTTQGRGSFGSVDDVAPSGPLSILSLSGSAGECSSDEERVSESRRTLAAHMNLQENGLARSVELTARHASRWPITATNILGFVEGLPLLSLLGKYTSEPMNDDEVVSRTSGLKEVVLPHFEDATYPDGSTLQSTMSDAAFLTRPALGLYQWPSSRGVVFRPIPSSALDQSVAPSSLVFRCGDLGQAVREMSDVGVKTAKIGYSGLNSNKHGQLMVLHPDLAGLDVRLTDRAEHNCGFAEAQQALMAGSLSELQNANVMLEGGHADTPHRAKSDPMNGLGDCWMEFRANLKQPSGFFKGRRDTRYATRMRIAKPPDLPYE